MTSILNIFTTASIIAWSDTKLRFRRTTLGLVWIIVNPFIVLFALSFVLRRLNLGISGEYFIPTMLVGILVWEFFSEATSTGIQSMLHKRGILKNTPISIVIFPLATTLQAAAILSIEIIISFILLSGIGFQWNPIQMVVVIPLILIGILTFGVSCAISAIGALYPDTVHVWRWILRLGFFITPVFYTLEAIPAQERALFLLNPVARILTLIREIMFSGSVSFHAIVFSICTSVLIGAGGYTILVAYTNNIRDKA